LIYHARLIEAVYAALGLMVLLTIAAFFLSESGRVNNFPTYVVGILFIVLLVLDRSVVRHFDVPLMTGIVGLLVYLSVSALWADNGSFTAMLLQLGYSALIVSFVYSVLMLHMHYPAFSRFLIWFTVLAAVVSATYSVQLHYALPDYQPLLEDRLVALGRLHNPVIGALSYGMAIVMALYLMIRGGEHNDRFLSGCCVTALGIGVALTYTRSVWVGISIAVLYAIARYLPGPKARKVLAAGIFLMVIVSMIVAHFGWDELIKRSTSFRPEIWGELISRTLQTNWFLGHGITSNSSVAHSSYEHGVFSFHHAHSVYVATFFYGGILGLLGLCALLIILGQRLNLARGSELRDLTSMMLLYAVAVMFFDGDRLLEKVDYLWVVFWLPVALTLIVDQQRRYL
jgi:O-antigen ligase